MSIVTSKKIYEKALKADWAVGGFIGYNLEIMYATIKAGLDVKAPIMVQNSCRVIDYAGAAQIRALAEAYGEQYKTDLVLHLDHGDTVERCKHCIDNGFSSVMLDCEKDSFEDNVRKTQEVVRYAHSNGVVVEGEAFHPVEGPEKYRTSLEEAVKYVELTGVDSLAVCCGNAHGISPEYQKKLRVEEIGAIHVALPDMPLVLHATSIFTPEFLERANVCGAGRKPTNNFSLNDLKESFRYGVCKVNSALDIKILFTTSIREYMLRNPGEMDPRKYLEYAREEIRRYIADKHVKVFMDHNQGNC